MFVFSSLYLFSIVIFIFYLLNFSFILTFEDFFFLNPNSLGLFSIYHNEDCYELEIKDELLVSTWSLFLIFFFFFFFFFCHRFVCVCWTGSNGTNKAGNILKLWKNYWFPIFFFLFVSSVEQKKKVWKKILLEIWKFFLMNICLYCSLPEFEYLKRKFTSNFQWVCLEEFPLFHFIYLFFL